MTPTEFNNSHSGRTLPLEAGFTRGESVTPNDSADLSNVSRLYIGVSGDVKVDTIGGSTITFKNHPVGYMPGFVKRVYATGTTASQILALW